jgi:hypothetical protein
VAKTVFDVLVEKLKEHRATYVDAVSSGRAVDFSVYREQCGLIRGLDLALREIQDLAQNYMDDAND